MIRIFGIDDPRRSVGDPDGAVAIEGIAATPGLDLLGLIVNRDDDGIRSATAREILARHGCPAPVASGEDTYAMARQVLAGAKPASVRLFCTGPFTEAAWLIGQPDLWQAIERVTVMAGVTRTADGWVPSSCSNVNHDPGAAAAFFAALQELGTPVTVVDNTTSIWAGIPADVWAQAAASPNPWVRQTAAAMHHQIQRMWHGVRHGLLPPGRTVAWFLDGWCGGVRPDPLPEQILPLVRYAPVYDVLAVAALLSDEPLTDVETHPACPRFEVLRPGGEDARRRAVAAQMRLIRAALNSQQR